MLSLCSALGQLKGCLWGVGRGFWEEQEAGICGVGRAFCHEVWEHFLSTAMRV
jgi:hypothetical protein